MWALFVITTIGVWAFWVYDGLVQLRRQADSAWSDLGMQLKHRDELMQQLRTNQEALNCRQTLTRLNEALRDAKQHYNTIVQDFNARLTVFPDRLIARAGKFEPKELFPLHDA